MLHSTVVTSTNDEEPSKGLDGDYSFTHAHKQHTPKV